MSISYKWLS